MIILQELKKIAFANAKTKYWADKLAEKLDCGGLNLACAELICGCKEINGHLYQDGARLDNYGLVDDLYYCSQHTGYCEDCYYGTLYFKTNVPGQFVAVPFDM